MGDCSRIGAMRRPSGADRPGSEEDISFGTDAATGHMNQKPIQHRAFGGVIAGLANVAITLAQSIVQVPLLLHFWNSDTYGTWNMVIATIALITALDGGHHAYLGSRFSLQWI